MSKRPFVLIALSIASVLSAWSADPSSPMVVSAAAPTVGVTADSLATIFGTQLSTVTQAAGPPPWPQQLGDISVVYVRDSANVQTQASLIFVSPTQINIWIPPGVAAGPANVLFPFTGLGPGVGTAALHVVPVAIQKTAPGLFSADGSGSGVAAASAVRVVIPTNFQSDVPVFSCAAATAASHGCQALPIALGIDTPVYLSLFGTGLRGASNVTVTIGGTEVQPTYAGPQGQTPGLDQVNFPIPLSLRVAGLVSLTVTADGVASNAVQVNIQ